MHKKLCAKGIGYQFHPCCCSDQTTVLPKAVLGLLRPLSLRLIYGVGHKTYHILGDAGITTVQDYLTASSGNGTAVATQAIQSLDKAVRQFLNDACRGVDPRCVRVFVCAICVHFVCAICVHF